MKSRWGALLAVIAITPALMGSGGFNPPPPGFKIVGPAVTATIVIDTHEGGGLASIRLDKGLLSSSALFTAPNAQGFFTRGCVVSLTEARFENVLLSTYVPEAIEAQLFAALGITVSGSNLPVITDTDSAVCTPDDASGTLSFKAIIQFAVPQSSR